MRRAAAVVAAVLLITAVLPRPASAAGDRPSWNVGDFWRYEGYTIVIAQLDLARRFEVAALEGLTQAGVTYSTVKAVQTDTTTVPFIGATTVVSNAWLRTTDLAFLKTEVAAAQTTTAYDPPAGLYQFPLVNGRAWSVSTTRTITIGAGSSSGQVTFDLSVTSETDLTVQVVQNGQSVTKAFHTFVVRQEDESGSGFWLFSYADEVGYFLKQEHWANANTKNTELTLKEFKYTPPTNFVLLVLILAVFLVAVIVAALLLRRKPPTPQPVAQYQVQPAR
ncbi:MAG TPA: hypothetical protein VJ397_03770 [Thermoplasmata archaeon]|nr:hypothetical protein [Thermoplasmata archaeon]